MAKNSYDVSNPQVGTFPSRKRDNSFMSCVCVMLVVLAICVLLLLVSLRWCRFGPVEKGVLSIHESTGKGIYLQDGSTHKIDLPSRWVYPPDGSTRKIDLPALVHSYHKKGVHKKISSMTRSSAETKGKQEDSINEYDRLRYTPRNTNSSGTQRVETTTENSTALKITTEIVHKELELTTTPNSTKIFIKNNNETVTFSRDIDPRHSGKIVVTDSATTEEVTTEVVTTEKSTTEDPTTARSEKTTINLDNSSLFKQTSKEEKSVDEETTTQNSATIAMKEKIVTTEVTSIPTISTDITEKTEKDEKLTEAPYTSPVVNESDLGSSTWETPNPTKPSLDFNSLLFKDKDTCNSTKCDLAAARIISLMDLSRQPCERFYDFSCGGVLGNKQEEINIFASKFIESEDTPEFLNKFHTFYRSCVKHEDRFHYDSRIEKAKQLLYNVGLFQFDGQANTTYNITEFVANLILFKAMPLFEVDVDIDPDNSSYILKLLMPDQTSLDFEHWSSLSESKRKCLRETDENAMGSPLNLTLLYRDFRNCQKNYSDYLDAIETSVRELGFFSNLTEKELFKHVRDIRVFIEFDVLPLFDEVAPPDSQELVVRRRYEDVKLRQLEKEFPIIQWEKLFSIISNENISSETVIQMYNRRYFEEVFRGLSELDSSKLNNAFLAILANSLFENTVLPSHRHSRVEYCKDRSRELMPDIVNYLHKKIIPSKELDVHNGYIKELYETLKQQFNESLHKVEWLDEESRISMRAKLDKIELVMFQVNDVESEKLYLEQSYDNLNLKHDEYQYNLFKLMEYRRKSLFSIQSQTVTPENMYRHFVDASREEPIFFYANDIVCIPYGLSKKATKDLPGYIVLAQVGFPVAKIIGHAFDPIGMQYNVQLSETVNMSYTNFADQTRDMIKLLSPISFQDRKLDFTLNNALSESERIAENTALRLLTESFNTFGNQSLLPWVSYKFSREKIFFLAIAQELCREMSLTEFMVNAYESSVLPPQFRIGNIFGNSGEFLKQFGCLPGSAMARNDEDLLQFPYLPEVSKEEMDYM